MTTDSKATPRPWGPVQFDTGQWGVKASEDTTGEMVAYVTLGGDCEGKTNAELIVRAVNAHDDLVAFTKEVLARVMDCDRCEGSGKDPHGSDFTSMHQQLRGIYLTDACHKCGGQGEFIDDVTGLLGEAREALQKARPS